MVFTKLVCDAPLLIPNPVGAVHVYKVPAGTIPFVISVGVLLKATPSQLVAVMAVIYAAGLTVTVTVNGSAAPQFTIIGVTR